MRPCEFLIYIKRSLLWNCPPPHPQTFQKGMFQHSSPAYQLVPASLEPTYKSTSSVLQLNAYTVCNNGSKKLSLPVLWHFPLHNNHWTHPLMCRPPPKHNGLFVWAAVNYEVWIFDFFFFFLVFKIETLTCLSLMANLSTSFFACSNLAYGGKHMYSHVTCDRVRFNTWIFTCKNWTTEVNWANKLFIAIFDTKKILLG